LADYKISEDEMGNLKQAILDLDGCPPGRVSMSKQCLVYRERYPSPCWSCVEDWAAEHVIVEVNEEEKKPISEEPILELHSLPLSEGEEGFLGWKRGAGVESEKGAEAEALRVAFELLAETPSFSITSERILQILDRIDAKDSLSYLEERDNLHNQAINTLSQERATLHAELSNLKRDLDLAKKLILSATSNVLHSMVLHSMGSQITAGTEDWLAGAKKLGAYHGPTVGRFVEAQDALEEWFTEHGFPEIPKSPRRELESKQAAPSLGRRECSKCGK
jgi:hypothetical protein